MKILCVDDEPNILSGYQRSLRKQFQIETAVGGADALEKIRQEGPYAVLVTDMRMPGMDGMQFLAAARQAAPSAVRIMLTGNADQKTAIDALNDGHVFRFLNKPCSPEELAGALSAALEQFRLLAAEKELLEKTLGGTIKMLLELLASVDPEMVAQAQALRGNMRLLAAGLAASGSLAPADLWPLELAALLAQIGSVTVPPFIVGKVRSGTPLSDAEQAVWQRIPETGYGLLRNIPRLETVAKIVRFQNKHFDGGGFPAGGHAGEAIPCGARMLKVLRDLAEIEARHVSRPGAFNLMLRQASRYDPHVLATARLCLHDPVLPDPAAPEPGVPLPLSKLVPGHVLVQDIVTADGKTLLQAGRQITEVLLETLHNYASLVSIQEPLCVRFAP